MFSFSLKWLWAHCLVIAAGFFLLAEVHASDPVEQPIVEGVVSQVSTIYRKGLGSYYELLVQSGAGSPDRVLIAKSVASESAVQGLVGQHIAAHVNWSSEASDLQVRNFSGFNPELVRQSALSHQWRYDFLAMVFAGSGLAIGLVTLLLTRRRNA